MRPTAAATAAAAAAAGGGPADVELGSLLVRDGPDGEAHARAPAEAAGAHSSDLADEDDGLKGGAPACACRRAEGNHILVYGKPRGRTFPFHCLMGPDWWCSLITLTLLVAPSVVLVFAAAPELSPSLTLVAAASSALCVGSFAMTAFSDPGVVKRQTRQQLEQQFQDSAVPRHGVLCEYCHVYRPAGARHCFECDACIRGHDHHCPWTGKCIGERNLQSFYVFLGSLLFHLILTIVSLNVWIMDD